MLQCGNIPGPAIKSDREVPQNDLEVRFFTFRLSQFRTSRSLLKGAWNRQAAYCPCLGKEVHPAPRRTNA
jgi:hypothetical protein